MNPLQFMAGWIIVINVMGGASYQQGSVGYRVLYEACSCWFSQGFEVLHTVLQTLSRNLDKMFTCFSIPVSFRATQVNNQALSTKG